MSEKLTLLHTFISKLDNLSKNRVVKDTTIYIAVSGGLDSVVLLNLCSHYQKLNSYRYCVIHCNHNLQKNSQSFQELTKQLSNRYSFPFKVYSHTEENTNQPIPKTSIENYAREVRYRYFSLELNSNDILLTAHHQSDQTETILHNLFRGSGVVGTAGMSNTSQRPYLHLRPLLTESAQTIRDYARHKKLEWIEDPMNRNLVYSRNFLRRKAIPIISGQYPMIDSSITKFGSHQMEACTLLIERASEDLNEVREATKENDTNTLNITKLKKLSPERQNNLLRLWLKKIYHVYPTKNHLIQIKQIIYAPNDSKGVFKTIHRWRDILAHVDPNKCSIPSADFIAKILAIDDMPFYRAFDRVGNESIVLSTGTSIKLHTHLDQLKIPPWKRQHMKIYYRDNQICFVALTNCLLIDYSWYYSQYVRTSRSNANKMGKIVAGGMVSFD